MSFNQLDKREKAYKNRRSVVDIIRGIIYSGIGIFLLLTDNPKIKVWIDGGLLYVFVGICFLISIFRFYAAYKQHYYFDKER